MEPRPRRGRGPLFLRNGVLRGYSPTYAVFGSAGKFGNYQLQVVITTCMHSVVILGNNKQEGQSCLPVSTRWKFCKKYDAFF